MFADLKNFVVEIDCDYDAVINPWEICYYPGECDNSFDNVELKFTFGTSEATFTWPMT